MREPSVTAYRLTTHCRFDAPLDLVWNAILAADSWPNWWPGIGTARLDPGATDGPWRRPCCDGITTG